MNLLSKFLDRIDYNSYEDLYENLKIHVPENFNFSYDVVDEYASTEPKKEALVWCDDNDEHHIFTFKDLSLASKRTANFLKMHGIKKGDRVQLMLRRRYEFWFFILALHRIGAIAVPATNMLAAADLEYRFNAADIKMVVAYDDPDLQKEIETAKAKSPSVNNLVAIGQPRQGWISFYDDYEICSSKFDRPIGEEATTNDDIMVIYFTSGTSSNPKMVAHTFTYPLGHIVTAKYWQNVVDGGRHLTVAETGWAKALWGKIYGQWIAGSAVFTYDMNTFIPGKLLEKMQEYKITTFCAPPTAYRYLLQHDLVSKYDLSSLKYCVTAGEALNTDIYDNWLKKTGIKMYEGYGQTELTLTMGNYPWKDPRPGSMGMPSPGYKIDIVDPEGNSCKPEEVGEIIIRIDDGKPFGMFGGYYRDAERTEKVFEGGVYHTGDTAWRDKDGYCWFIGRTDDLIKSSGYRISPFEVEEVLLKHPAVMEVAVTGVEDASRGQAIKATIVLHEGYTASKELAKEIQLFTKKVAASYKSPRIIDFVSELPKTISGKIRRATIRDNDKQKTNEKA